jgi:hypothetical protein
MIGLNDKGEWGTGYLFGMNVNYQCFKLEVNYIQKGGSYALYNPNIGWFDVFNRNAQYIQFPMSVHFGEYGEDYENSVYDFDFGLAPASLLSVVSEINHVSYRSSLQYKTFTLDAFAGAGINFNDHVFLSLRFSWSVFPDVKREAVPKGFFWQTFDNGHTLTRQLVLRITFGKDED